MSCGKQALLAVSCGGMELSWRQAWAGYLLLLAFGRRFPLLEAAASLAVAVIVTHGPRRWGWRLYQAFALRLVSFVACALLVVHRIWYPGTPLLSSVWITHALGGFNTAPSGYACALAVVCLYLVWRGGRALGVEPGGEIRFDRGIGMFLLLLLVQFVARQKAGDLTEDRASLFLVPAFYLFGLMALGLAQDRQQAERWFRVGYRGVGTLLSASAGGVALASATTLLLYPQLTALADSLQVVLRAVGRPLGAILTRVLLFLFSPRNLRGAGARPPAASDQTIALPEAADAPWGNLLFKILGYVVMGLFAALVLIALAIAVRALLRRLWGRYTPEGPRPRPGAWLRRLLAALVRLPALAGQLLLGLMRGTDRAAQVFRGLLRWGRSCGLPAAPHETPAEYGARVALRFPMLRPEIAVIVEGFHREVYGEMPTERDALARLLRARRGLCSPRHWPARLGVLLR